MISKCFKNVTHITEFQTLKYRQKHHKTLRATFLEELFEVIVLDKAPTLPFDSVQHVKAERVDWKLKQLIKGKKTRYVLETWTFIEERHPQRPQLN